MRVLLALFALILPLAASAETELRVFGAMVEDDQGGPLATATLLSSEGPTSFYVTSTQTAQIEGRCLRSWERGECHLVLSDRSGPLSGLEGLSILAVQIPNDETMGKFSELNVTQMPRTGVLDPAADKRAVSILTQNEFGGWQLPLDPAQVTGRAADGFSIAGAGLNPLSVGAPVVHPEKGLVGVIAQAGEGGARVVGITALFEALEASGYPVIEQMRPKSGGGELPRAVENALGRLYLFNDYRDIGQGLAGFYGPADGLGFDPNFTAAIEYSSWAIGPDGPGLLASDTKAVPMSPAGISLEAAHTGGAPDLAASCVVHATPTSQGRRAMVLQFWRAVPERYNPNTGSKSYDEAAPPVIGWADGASPCAERLANLDTASLAVQRGQAQAPNVAASASAPASDDGGTEDGWTQIAAWPVTGTPALAITLADGRRLVLGCTESREFLLALDPAEALAGFLIGGRAAFEQGQAQGMAYGYFLIEAFDRLAAGASIGFELNGQAFDLPGPQKIGASPLGDSCRD